MTTDNRQFWTPAEWIAEATADLRARLSAAEAQGEAEASERTLDRAAFEDLVRNLERARDDAHRLGEALREALAGIAEHDSGWITEGDEDWTGHSCADCDDMKAIARRALEGAKGI